MRLDEVRRRIDKLQEGTSSWPSQVATTDGYVYDLQTVYRAICDVTKALDELEEVDDPPVNVDDGFAILPMARYEALREAEENLQETRFEPADGEADEAALARRVDELRRINEDLHGLLREQAVEVGRLREAAKVRAEAAAPLRTAEGDEEMSRRVDHLMRKTDVLSNTDGVHMRHLQDLQAEIGGIKDRAEASEKHRQKYVDAVRNRMDELYAEFRKVNGRLDEGCGQFNGISAAIGNLRDGAKVAGNELCRLNDRINAVAARVNRLDADVMPIRRIGPGTGPEDQQRDEATRGRLLQEIERAAGGVEPKPS
jgi:chaperonin cofactor prefoldin